MTRYRIKIEDRVYEVEVEQIDQSPQEHEETETAAKAPVLSTNGGGLEVKAPLAGTIMSVKANVGEKVTAGDVLLTLEALKLENEITAPASGTVVEIVSQGVSVEMDQIIAIIN